MTKIVHIITNLDTGGAEMMLFKLLSRMDRNRFDQIVVSLVGVGTPGRMIEKLGIPVYVLGISSALNYVPALYKITKLFGRFRPDIIQGWMYHGNIASVLVRIIYFRKVIILWNIRHSLHDISREKKLTAVIIRLGVYLSKVLPLRTIIYNSYRSVEQHSVIGYPKQKALVLPNGFDCEAFKPSVQKRRKLRSELKIRNSTIIIGLFARYHPMKDHRNFLTAAGLLAKKYNNVHFILAGRGVDHRNQKLVDIISQGKIDKKVSLLGERKDIKELTATLDIACSTSAFGEGFSNAIGEAMASGIPCVVTNIGDSSIIVGKTGIVVTPGNTSELCSALEQLISIGREGRLKLGMLARERVIENYSLENIVNKYQSLYESI